MARKVTAAEARQAMLDVGFTAEGCLDRMEGEGIPEFAAWETLFCLLSEDGANIDHLPPTDDYEEHEECELGKLYDAMAQVQYPSQTEDAVWQVNGVVELYCKEGDPAFAAMALLKEHSETLTSLMDTLEAETAKHKEASAYLRCVENDLNNAMASIEHLEGEIALLRRHLEPQWTSEKPTHGGYWPCIIFHDGRWWEPFIEEVRDIDGVVGFYCDQLGSIPYEDAEFTPIEKYPYECMWGTEAVTFPPAPANQEGRS